MNLLARLAAIAAMVALVTLATALDAAETKTIIVDGCTKVETEYATGGGPATMTVRCIGETGGPMVRQETIPPGNASVIPPGTIPQLGPRNLFAAPGIIDNGNLFIAPGVTVGGPARMCLSNPPYSWAC